jgi:hypothetical protein
MTVIPQLYIESLPEYTENERNCSTSQKISSVSVQLSLTISIELLSTEPSGND